MRAPHAFPDARGGGPAGALGGRLPRACGPLSGVCCAPVSGCRMPAARLWTPAGRPPCILRPSRRAPRPSTPAPGGAAAVDCRTSPPRAGGVELPDPRESLALAWVEC
ncbi:hypothetical protein GCM10010282_49150 [Streptomyces roseolus]|nr:hypothetical protein GCM10010282_49150 [Streptomyces roseolus]